jgi:hypothetical protein
VRQLSVERAVERGHEPQELLAGVLVEQELEVRLLRLGLWRVLLEELLVLQLVVAKQVVAELVDLLFRSSREPLWPTYRFFVLCCMNPIRAAAFL